MTIGEHVVDTDLSVYLCYKNHKWDEQQKTEAAQKDKEPGPF